MLSPNTSSGPDFARSDLYVFNPRGFRVRVRMRVRVRVRVSVRVRVLVRGFTSYMHALSLSLSPVILSCPKFACDRTLNPFVWICCCCRPKLNGYKLTQFVTVSGISFLIIIGLLLRLPKCP
jgi:hypothetical protein